MKKYIVLALTLLMLLSMTACGQNQDSPEEKTQAPNIFIYDAEGNQVTLNSFRGKPVVLNFWASWCEPCKAEMSGFQKAYDEHGDEIQFVMVNLTDGEDETVETASAYIDQQGFTFPVYFDTNSLSVFLYGIQSIPATFFIDAEGYVVTYTNSMLTQDQLQQGIDMLLD